MKLTQVMSHVWRLPEQVFNLPTRLYQHYHRVKAKGYALEATLRRARLSSSADQHRHSERQRQLWDRDEESLDYLDFMAAYHTAEAEDTDIPHDYHGPKVHPPW